MPRYFSFIDQVIIENPCQSDKIFNIQTIFKKLYYKSVIILINWNMCFECVRQITNRSDTLPKEQMKCIILNFLLFSIVIQVLFKHWVFLCNLIRFVSSFESNIAPNKEIFQLFKIVAPILSLLKTFTHCKLNIVILWKFLECLENLGLSSYWSIV